MKIARILESLQGVFIHNYFQQLLTDTMNELRMKHNFASSKRSNNEESTIIAAIHYLAWTVRASVTVWPSRTPSLFFLSTSRISPWLMGPFLLTDEAEGDVKR